MPSPFYYCKFNRVLNYQLFIWRYIENIKRRKALPKILDGLKQKFHGTKQTFLSVQNNIQSAEM